MAIDLLPDPLWNEVNPLLPPHKRHPKGGHPWSDDRECLRGIIFVLRSGMAWNLLPPELGCGSGVTCWRRFRDWTQAGIWRQVHERLLEHLNKLGEIDLSKTVIDSCSVRAVFGGRTPGPTPPIVRKAASNVTSSRKRVGCRSSSKRHLRIGATTNPRSQCSNPSL